MFRVVFFFAILSHSFAAAPLFHVYVAEMWMETNENYSEDEKRSFILGTLFPDIRYLGVISREETHEESITVQDLIETKDPFLKGKRLHAFVDETRAQFLNESGLLDQLEEVPSEHIISFLKFLEDEILYGKRDWKIVRRYLETIDAKEREFNIPLEAIFTWHQKLSGYLGARPSDLLLALKNKNRGFMNVPAGVIQSWSELFPRFAQKEEVKNYLASMMKRFEELFLTL